MVNFRTHFKDKANVAYMVAGYPDLKMTKSFIEGLDRTNIDILELGIAYSDPIADGKIISEAALKALEKGATIHKVFELLSEVKTSKILVFLVYYNVIFSYGLQSFVKKAKEVGIKGLIVPDLPFEENEELFRLCEEANLALIPLISVTTPKPRIKEILSRGSGFVYAVASVGITGGKRAEQAKLKTLVKDIREESSLPVFLGFGIKTKKDVQKIKQICDGAIVGTSIVQLFKEYKIREIFKKIKEIFE
ncbi:tryptophan synthase subunit alpha [Campylobacter sp. MIT 99-7217]|uniref:tryptophan synthase subunit alpha n=1 Tax=Campylobacter sp. MIT 99-7217 TaxID=535091 RepID=UPI001158CC25|nr:tryptophan synthase subunit alpha [Campylobacter sp. MIT 99-7217]TQR33119.1 tryptophan synthase subunit alpha [Campylobacter sp. MIT 99-7217]